MIFFVLSIAMIIMFIIKYYKQYHHHHFYSNFEQFNQYYCQPFASLINDDENFPLSAIDRFHKCENKNNHHIKSNMDCMSIYKYIQEFICQSNEYTNRPGPVCPFVPTSLKQNSMYFFISNDQYNTKERIIKMVEQCKYDFLYNLKPNDGNRDRLIYKCLVMLIRSSDVPHSLIDEIQIELKPSFLQDGLMFGEFHQSANSNAIRNESFYPTRTNVPLLVIRYMVANDIIFLTNQEKKYPVETCVNMIKKYLELYHLGSLYRSKPNHLQSANDILEQLNCSIKE
ncbi:unnamed protein product [Adineta steineri]|uniref:DUF6875 domain-containing protein n=1 Tax=Adineta steineri TaxID=433720 RepID=A0A815Q6M9_9BILA|nr:unnamed protein product [Adineta steineri]CAF4107109.1 unnamed protein product [Adineta steineri]